MRKTFFQTMFWGKYSMNSNIFLWISSELSKYPELNQEHKWTWSTRMRWPWPGSIWASCRAPCSVRKPNQFWSDLMVKSISIHWLHWWVRPVPERQHSLSALIWGTKKGWHQIPRCLSTNTTHWEHVSSCKTPRNTCWWVWQSGNNF